MLHARRTLTVAAILMVGNIACEQLLPPDPANQVASVTLSPSDVDLYPGDQTTVRATVLSSTGAQLATPVSFTSSHPSVATVNASTGLVTAVAVGETFIRGTAKGVTGSMHVWVFPAPQRLTITITPGTVPAGHTLTVRTRPVPTLQCTLGPAGPSGTCTGLFPAGELVELQAFGSYAFVGWDGVGCFGTMLCTVQMNQARTVTANFLPASAATLNLGIQTVVVAQAVQTPDHSVDLVAGRDAYVRVFGGANHQNPPVQPKVRVRLYHGTQEVQQWLLPGIPAPFPFGNDASLSSTWNVLVPGALVQPGMRILAQIDPEGLIPELLETDNQHPVTGQPRSITVHALPPLPVRFVSVRINATGLQGEITPGNMDSFFPEARKWLPVAAVAADIRATPYIYSGPALGATDDNNGWGILLNELIALRNTTDQSTRYYYGVVKLPGISGISGIAFRSETPTATSKAALGVDHPTFRSVVFAHEIGHLLGNRHAPGCGAQQVDEMFPGFTGVVDAWGIDVETLEVKTAGGPYDYMSYCYPKWTSAYHWRRALDFRRQSPVGAPPPTAPMTGGPEDGLLVWGRIGPDGVVLEPAFRVAPIGTLAPAAGTWRVEGRDEAGVLVFSRSFEPDQMADLPGDPRAAFALVIPLGASTADRIATLRVEGPGGVAELGGGAFTGGDPGLLARRLPGGLGRLTWDATRYPVALVRDGATGEIISFARNGSLDLPAGIGVLDVQLSGGVRGVQARMVLP